MRRRATQRKLTADELTEAMQWPLVTAMKAGPLRNGCERGHGSVFHWVPNHTPTSARGCRNLSSIAICGARASIAFTEAWRDDQVVSCPKCLKIKPLQ